METPEQKEMLSIKEDNVVEVKTTSYPLLFFSHPILVFRKKQIITPNG